MVIDYDLIDLGKKVSDEAAFATCRVLATRFGILVGGSAGGAIYQALLIASEAPAGSQIVTIACDAGSKYVDTIYDDGWLLAKEIRFDREMGEVIAMLDL